MILQIDYSEITWIVGLGLLFALALTMNYLLRGNLKTLILWIMIFDSFMVWTDLLDSWTIILCLIFSFGIIFYQVNENRGKNR